MYCASLDTFPLEPAAEHLEGLSRLELRYHMPCTPHSHVIQARVRNREARHLAFTVPLPPLPLDWQLKGGRPGFGPSKGQTHVHVSAVHQRSKPCSARDQPLNELDLYKNTILHVAPVA